MAERRRLNARVVGRVQGVGFRWWTRRQAEQLGLTGWVRNDDDERTVEVVAEGATEELQELERQLRRGPHGARVDSVDARWEPASGEFSSFEIGR